MSRFKWWRRWRGGTWACWLTPAFGEVWLRNSTGRPWWARGRPLVEDYDWEELAAMTDAEVDAELRAAGVDVEASVARFRALFLRDAA